jgi:hypothetical protein
VKVKNRIIMLKPTHITTVQFETLTDLVPSGGQVLLLLKFTAFWHIAPCSLIEVYRRFNGAYCLHQGEDVGGSIQL